MRGARAFASLGELYKAAQRSKFVRCAPAFASLGPLYKDSQRSKLRSTKSCANSRRAELAPLLPPFAPAMLVAIIRMFTGLVEAVGHIQSRERRGGDARMRFAFGGLPIDGLSLGESIAVSGCCLTVVEFDAASFAADVSNESLSRTTLGGLPVGGAVNLERAMLPTTRFGGHMVAGHVDGVGRVETITADGRAQRWRFSAPPSLLRYIAEKGSICVDGVSLTVNQADVHAFEVALIPHTLAHTAFAQATVGDEVNLEVDLVARYVERLFSVR